ncbi:MAG: nucleotidyltransferase family protein [Candidatus Hermodarchaeota archaeon]
MKAVVLCAGYGKRLKPYTDIIQKSMLSVHNKPVLEYILRGLIHTGLKDIVLVVGYKKEQIYDYFKNGKNLNINIEYIEQRKLNGTGGALLECEKVINNSHFFLTWGDIIVPYSVYKEILNLFEHKHDNFILVSNYTNDPFKGAAVYIKDNYCLDIIEKPPRGESKSKLNNSGIFIFSKEIFEVLNTLKPSKRGEIELTDALRVGIKSKNWKVRVVKMKKNQFRGDFGDMNTYEILKEKSSWLSELVDDKNDQ